MQKWEYLRLSVQGHEYSINGDKHLPFLEGENRVTLFQKLGQEGWELTGLDTTRTDYWFKRPLE